MSIYNGRYIYCDCRFPLNRVVSPEMCFHAGCSSAATWTSSRSPPSCSTPSLTWRRRSWTSEWGGAPLCCAGMHHLSYFVLARVCRHHVVGPNSSYPPSSFNAAGRTSTAAPRMRTSCTRGTASAATCSGWRAFLRSSPPRSARWARWWASSTKGSSKRWGFSSADPRLYLQPVGNILQELATRGARFHLP